MFKIQKNINVFTYTIILDDALIPFIELLKEINSFSAIDNSIFDLVDISKVEGAEDISLKLYILEKEVKRIDELKNGTLTESEIQDLDNKRENVSDSIKALETSALSIISIYFTNHFFNDINIKPAFSKIIFIDKSNRIIVFDGGANDLKKCLFKIFTETNILNLLESILISEKSKACIAKMSNFNNQLLYSQSNCLTVNLKFLINIPLINKDFINIDFVESSIFEEGEIWINKEKIQKDYSINITNTNKNILRDFDDKSIVVGFILDDYFINNCKDPSRYILEDKKLDYYWFLIKNNIYKIPHNGTYTKTTLIDEFKETSKNDEFSELLSFLKFNLYIENQTIKEDFQKFFDHTIKVRDIKHIEDFEFYLPNLEDKDKSILGIYHLNKKPSEDHFNLFHWISNEDDKQINHFVTSSNRDRKDKEFVYTLKPEISFYFREKFFEDFFEKSLKECGVDYVCNYKIAYKDGGENEIDFIIKLKDTLLFIETKTKLNLKYITDFENKSDNYMQKVPSICKNLKFFIVSAYSDDDCSTYKHYIEKGKIDHNQHNQRRGSYNTIPYWFEFPITKYTDKTLTCIAEPSYNKLKEIIKDICLE